MPLLKMPRSFASRDRAGKSSKAPRRSFRDATKKQMLDKLGSPVTASSAAASPNLTSPIVTLVVGREQRLFAGHEDVISLSPYFAAVCRSQFFGVGSDGLRRIDLLDEEPEVFSCVLEYLYKGDYYPRLVHDKRCNTWVLDDAPDEGLPRSPHPLDSSRINRTDGAGGGLGGAGRGSRQTATFFHSAIGEHILRDTAVYCAAERFGLEELKRLALRKQGLQSGIEVGTILRSARYAYANTPDSDSRLRAHYLALIVRSRRTFKRSGTMQAEMEVGGKLFFDLFVAMCNHIDDITEYGNSHTPRTI